MQQIYKPLMFGTTFLAQDQGTPVQTQPNLSFFSSKLRFQSLVDHCKFFDEFKMKILLYYSNIVTVPVHCTRRIWWHHWHAGCIMYRVRALVHQVELGATHSHITVSTAKQTFAHHAQHWCCSLSPTPCFPSPLGLFPGPRPGSGVT